MGHNMTFRLCRRKWFRKPSWDQVREAQAVPWGGAPREILGAVGAETSQSSGGQKFKVKVLVGPGSSVALGRSLPAYSSSR